MVRKAFKMKVYPDFYDEYKKRHDYIWSEMLEMLAQYGVNQYSIFLDKETGFLFAYLEIADVDLWNKSSETEICQKWWEYMKDIMETNEDNSPVAIELDEVFRFEPPIPIR